MYACINLQLGELAYMKMCLWSSYTRRPFYRPTEMTKFPTLSRLLKLQDFVNSLYEKQKFDSAS